MTARQKIRAIERAQLIAERCGFAQANPDAYLIPPRKSETDRIDAALEILGKYA